MYREISAHKGPRASTAGCNDVSVYVSHIVAKILNHDVIDFSLAAAGSSSPPPHLTIRAPRNAWPLWRHVKRTF